jgi:acyl transferase domain-containing protein
VISGPGDDLEEVIARLEARGFRARRLRVSHAFHSPMIEPILADLEAIAERCAFAVPRVPLVANSSGAFLADGAVPAAKHWVRQMREPVRFAAGVRALWESGCRLFLEIGPPTLVTLGEACTEAEDGDAAWLALLSRVESDWDSVLEAVAALHVRGVAIRWSEVERPRVPRRVAAPTYPFQRARHWLPDGGEPPASAPAGSPAPDRQPRVPLPRHAHAVLARQVDLVSEVVRSQLEVVEARSNSDRTRARPGRRVLGASFEGR